MQFGTEYEKFPDPANPDEPVIVDVARLREKLCDWSLYEPIHALKRPLDLVASDEVVQNARSLITMIAPYIKSWHKKQVAEELKKEWLEKFCATSTPSLLYFPDLTETFSPPSRSDLEFVAHPFMHPFISNVKIYVVFVDKNTVWDYVIMV